MLLFQKALFVVIVFSGIAQATSVHPDTFREEVAPALQSISATEVGNEGKVVRERREHPYTHYLIAVPVTVSTGDTCTHFVGQHSRKNGSLIEIQAMGARSPLTEACIALFPAPVQTKFTFQMDILTGGFVPAPRYHHKIVQFHGVGMHRVTLDLNTKRVIVQPLNRVAR